MSTRSYVLGLCLVALASCSQANGVPLPSGSSSTALTAVHPFARTAHTGAYTSLYSFQNYPSDGEGPNGLVVWNGRLYGTTQYGGIATSKSSQDCKCGTIFSSSGSSEDVLYTFTGPVTGGLDGAQPLGALTAFGTSLFGTTEYGGQYGKGTTFSLTGSGEHVADSLGQGSGPANPVAALYDTGTTLLGASEHGGKRNDGAVFELDMSGFYAPEVFHSFNGTDGLFPQAGFVKLPGTHLKSALFSVATHGGANGFGTVYEVSTTGTIEATLYNFKGGKDGAYPTGLTVLGNTMYGVTAGGGPGCKPLGGCGTIFSVDATGKETVLYSFRGGKTDGEQPQASMLAYNGALWGTTYHGGATNGGTVFVFEPSTKTETVLYAFQGGLDGGYPSTSLVALNGVLYGTTGFGGQHQAGTIYKIVPTIP